MIQVSNTLKLTEITIGDQEKLFDLMTRIYVPVYEHFWEDQGKSYIESLYNDINLKKELEDLNACYYFVHYTNEVIGILRILKDAPLSDVPIKKAAKIHRIYLDPKIQGKGLGKTLLNWVEIMAKDSGKDIIWLEAMDQQQAAVGFYKSVGFVVSGTFSFNSKIMHAPLRGMYRMWKSLH